MDDKAGANAIRTDRSKSYLHSTFTDRVTVDPAAEPTVSIPRSMEASWSYDESQLSDVKQRKLQYFGHE